MQAGDAFMILDEGGGKEHLHVLLTSPSETEEVVTTCICSRTRRSETLTLLNVGDHPFIRHESYVAYNFSKVRTCSAIVSAIARGEARPQARASDQLLARMRQGLLDSDFAPNGVKSYFRSLSPSISGRGDR